MPQFVMKHKETACFLDLDDFTQGYIQAIFFTDTGPDDEGLEDVGFLDLAEESLFKIVQDCKEFYAANKDDLGEDLEQAGMDFWLTRNHHGTGFWDRPDIYGYTNADKLTENSQKYKECYVYMGDDGLVYVE